jgi:P4 family phage/plasmid primase-like protien
MATQLAHFLSNNRARKGEAFTHTSLGDPKGCFKVQDSDIERFLELYTKTVTEGYAVSLTEKPKNISPVLIDLDFRQTTPERLYDSQYIESFLNIILHVMKEYVTQDTISCYILEKPAPRPYKDIYKDGIHITFPDVITPANVQHTIRNIVITMYPERVTPNGVTNPVEDIYDKNVIVKNNWFMYGSKKPDEMHPWKVTRAYIFSSDKATPLEIGPIENLVKTLSIRYNVTEENMSQVNQEKLSKIIDGLNPKRARDYNTWRDGIYAIMNTADNKEEGGKLCHIYAQKDRGSYNIEATDKQIEESLRNQYRKNKVTVATLFSWLKEDNPSLFHELTQSTLIKLIHKTVSRTDYDLALLVDHMFGQDYRSVEIRDKMNYYHFDNHRWNKENSMTSLNLKICHDVHNKIMEVAEFQNKRATDENRKDLDEMYKQLVSVANMLKKKSVCDNVIKYVGKLREVNFHDFYEKLDTHPNLIGFKNGVYDLDSDIFRDGDYDDLLTFTTGYDYIEEDNDDIQNELERFMDSITPNKDVKEFIFNMIAYSLHGNKRFHDANLAFFCGTGANGKSLLKVLVMQTFGDYGYEPDVSIVCTKKMDSSRANPELAKTKGKRICLASEPESDQKFQVSALKKFTGGDKIQARELYASNIEFDPQFSMIILMNNKPSLSDMDGGIIRRMNIVTFPYKFVPNPMLSFERKMDTSLDDKFRKDIRYAQQFMRILIRRYKEEIRDTREIKKPQEVIDDTQRYIEDNDAVKAFIMNSLELTEDENDMIPSSEMYEMFKKSEFYNQKDRSWFKQQMTTHGLEAKKKTTRGEYYTLTVYRRVKRVIHEDMDFLGL